MVDRSTPHTITGRSPYEVLFGKKMRIGCISPDDQQHKFTENMEENMRESVEKKKKKSKEYYDAKHKAKKHNFHVGEEVVVKDKKDGEYIPDIFLITAIKGSSIEAKRNSDGKVVFRDASHFKVYHRRNNPLANIEIQNTNSTTMSTGEATSVLDVNKRPTRTTAGKARKRFTYDVLGEPVNDAVDESDS